MADTIKPFDDGKGNGFTHPDKALEDLMAYKPAKPVKKKARQSQASAQDFLLSADYKDLVWELKAPKEEVTDGQKVVNLEDKALFTFDESQVRLFQAGYERHPMIREAFALICAYLDDQKNKTNVLGPKLTKVAEDMIEGRGEFFCQAIETTQEEDMKQVIFYEHVIALPQGQDGTYSGGGLDALPNPSAFDISDLELGTTHHYRHIYQKHGLLVQYTHSREFNDLPVQIKQDAGIWLPPPETIWPVGYYKYGVVGLRPHSASRGVRERKSRKTNRKK